MSAGGERHSGDCVRNNLRDQCKLRPLEDKALTLELILVEIYNLANEYDTFYIPPVVLNRIKKLIQHRLPKEQQ